MFRPKEIHEADDHDQAHRRDRSVFARNTQVTDRRPTAQCSRDNKIRDEQERAGRSEKAALLSRRGINAAAIREMRADNDVVVGDDGGEQADRENDRQRRKSRRDERETDDVGLARSPIAVEEGSGAFPIHIARPMHSRRIENGSHQDFNMENAAKVEPSRRGMTSSIEIEPPWITRAAS